MERRNALQVTQHNALFGFFAERWGQVTFAASHCSVHDAPLIVSRRFSQAQSDLAQSQRWKKRPVSKL
jgi:hypothetical protein